MPTNSVLRSRGEITRDKATLGLSDRFGAAWGELTNRITARQHVLFVFVAAVGAVTVGLEHIYHDHFDRANKEIVEFNKKYAELVQKQSKLPDNAAIAEERRLFEQIRERLDGHDGDAPEFLACCKLHPPYFRIVLIFLGFVFTLSYCYHDLNIGKLDAYLDSLEIYHCLYGPLPQRRVPEWYFSDVDGAMRRARGAKWGSLRWSLFILVVLVWAGMTALVWILLDWRWGVATAIVLWLGKEVLERVHNRLFPTENHADRYRVCSFGAFVLVTLLSQLPFGMLLVVRFGIFRIDNTWSAHFPSVAMTWFDWVVVGLGVLVMVSTWGVLIWTIIKRIEIEDHEYDLADEGKRLLKEREEAERKAVGSETPLILDETPFGTVREHTALVTVVTSWGGDTIPPSGTQTGA